MKKGGGAAATRGRKCLCNGLMANVGLGQVSADGSEELALLTAGDDVAQIARFLTPGGDSYTANDVVRQLMAGSEAAEPLNGKRHALLRAAELAAVAN